MENINNNSENSIKKYLTNQNTLFAIMATSVLIWITSLMNWITSVTSASSTVTDTADSISSFFGIDDNSTSNAISSINSTTTGNLWKLTSEGEKASTYLGWFFILFVIVTLILAYLSFAKQKKSLKKATGIFGIISSLVYLFIALGYSAFIESLSDSTSSSSYGLASMSLSYSIGYKLFIILSILLLVESIFYLITRSKKAIIE